MWFIFAIITVLAWSLADLFYKKSAEASDRYSHLKTSMVVGFVMGIHAVFMLIFTDMNYNFLNILIYLPVSIMYISSMTVGYFGLRYLELSLSSPIQNSSGAVTSFLCFLILGQRMSSLSLFGVIAVSVGVFILGVLEKKKQYDPNGGDKKYKIGFIAFMMPVLYCFIDSLGTFMDAFYLDDIASTPLLDVTEGTFENVANTSYELTFLICAVAIFVFLKFIRKERFSFFSQKNRSAAAVLETAGQFSYVFALGGNAVVAAPMIASYSIFSVFFSRIFLKERLSKKQYAVIALVILGIAALGIAEGLEA